MAVVAAALDRGASVTLLAANVEVSLPERCGPDRGPRRVHGRPRARPSCGIDDRPMASAPASMRWSWPRRWPTSGRPTAADRKLERGGSLTLELEPTPDLLAEVAHRSRPTARGPTRSRRSRAGARRVRRRDRARWSGPRTSSGARAWTSWSRTTSRRRAPGSGPTPTGSPSSPRDGTRDDLPLLTKREVADAILDRVARALDERDAAAQTGRRTEPAREPA